MSKYIKSTLLILAGIIWLAAALALAALLLQFLCGGAGSLVGDLFGVSSATVTFELVPVLGFAVLAGFCFLIGMGLCVHGLVPEDKISGNSPTHNSNDH